jgi:hypothetical protein
MHPGQFLLECAASETNVLIIWRRVDSALLRAGTAGILAGYLICTAANGFSAGAG